MRGILPLFGVVLAGSSLALSQPPAHNPVSVFEQQLIEREKQLLQDVQNQNSSVVERSIADDFQGIGSNGDFYDKSEIVDSAAAGRPKDKDRATRAYDFRVVKLSNDSAVVAYNLIAPGEHPRYRHMTDTWAKVGSQWKLKFRQITPNLWSENDLD
jgi:hypothetical protein